MDLSSSKDSSLRLLRSVQVHLPAVVEAEGSVFTSTHPRLALSELSSFPNFQIANPHSPFAACCLQPFHCCDHDSLFRRRRRVDRRTLSAGSRFIECISTNSPTRQSTGPRRSHPRLLSSFDGPTKMDGSAVVSRDAQHAEGTPQEESRGVSTAKIACRLEASRAATTSVGH